MDLVLTAAPAGWLCSPTMRVLLVSHRFPPHSAAGTEVYTAELARRLQARGHEVHVFSSHKDTGRDDLTLERRSHEGVPVTEVINNLYHESFEQTWQHPGIDRVFREEVQRIDPEVIHFQHLMYLSVGCLEVAREAGAAVLMTLHDYWLECPRMGQLVHADGELCHTVEFERCGTCLPSFSWTQSASARRAGQSLAGLRRVTGLDFAPLARKIHKKISRPSDSQAGVDPRTRDGFAEFASKRADVLRQCTTASVQRFLAPSRFMRERFVRWGLDADSIHYTPTGLDPLGAGAASAPASDGATEVLFLGSFIPIKGAHVLLEAWGQLDPALRSQAHLRLHGPVFQDVDYAADLGRRAQAVGAMMGEGLDRAGVRAALARADLLVVPSLWFENRPLVLMEAMGAGVPVVVSDLGGMAELVEEGVSGWTFPMGDASALAAVLSERLRTKPDSEAVASAGASGFPTWEEATDQVLEHYAACLASRGSAG
jgi:glycosyltransferase involved in cell wall biosynthesis